MAESSDRRALHGGLLRAMLATPAVLAVVGGLAGLAIAAGALAADRSAEWQFIGVSAASARTMFGALLTGAITATAVLFWVRGMLVQLAAGEIAARVLRNYLDDRFLNVAFAFLVAVFTHALVTLLWLPGDGAEPVAATSALTGALLATFAVVLIIHAVHDSVRALSPSRVLGAITLQTLAAARRVYPPHREAPAAPEGAADGGSGRQLGTVTAARSGWVGGIDVVRLSSGLPRQGVARVAVMVGDFVTEGSTLVAVSARGDAEAWDPETVRSAISLEGERQLGNDPEYGLLNLVGLALHSLGSGTSDRATAFEALRCLCVVLEEILRRDPVQPAVTYDGDRVVVRRFARGHADVIRASVGELAQAARQSPEFARAMHADLQRLASRLRQDGFASCAELVDAEIGALGGAPDGRPDRRDGTLTPLSPKIAPDS